MRLTKQLKAMLEENPMLVQGIPNPSEEIQMLCVKTNAWSLTFIENPTPAVLTQAYRGEYSLIQNNPNPTEEQQVAAATNSFFVFDYLENPCRAAALVILREYGAYLSKMPDTQKKYGTNYAASDIPVYEDLELQVAALSNITGISLYCEKPEFFNSIGLAASYPSLMAAVNTWATLSFDPSNAEEIRQHLQTVKEIAKASLPAVQLPTDLTM